MGLVGAARRLEVRAEPGLVERNGCVAWEPDGYAQAVPGPDG